LSREQWDIAKEKADSPAAKAAIVQTAAQTDGAKKIAAPAPAPTQAKAEPEPEAVIAEPTKRASKKTAEPAPKKDFVDVLNAWTSDDE